MYSLENLWYGLNNPRRAIDEVNSLLMTRGNRPNPNGIKVFDEDWDIFILLDACRYDAFSAVNQFNESLEKRESQGSATYEWMSANFRDRDLHDLVYVDANSWYPRLKDEINTEVYNYLPVERDMEDGLSCRPETVTDTALSAAGSYPDKRLLIHYMQPHSPFLGELASKFEYQGALHNTVLASGLSKSTVRQAYRDSLKKSLGEVERLCNELEGKIVISADHGELLGERVRPIPIVRYGHPGGNYIPELVEVPWLELNFESRREVIPEKPVEEDTSVEIQEAEERLEALGYK